MQSSNAADLEASNAVARSTDIDDTPGVKRAQPHQAFRSGGEDEATKRRDVEEYTEVGGIHASASRGKHVPLPSSQPSQPSSTGSHNHEHGAAHERDLAAAGHLPGLSEAGPEHRAEGQEDEAGNRIPHRGVLSRLVHGEHSAANAER